jgi:hypothetical protein
MKKAKVFWFSFSKKNYFLLLFFWFIFRPSARAEDSAFETALSQAYLYNPQLLAARQQLREADEGVPKALSGWRPRSR